MEKIIKICCVAGLGASLLFLSACNEEQAPAPKLTKQALVISKPISKSKQPASQQPFPPLPDLKPDKDSVKESQARGDGDGYGADALQKAGISKPMEKYDSKVRVRVDPFIPLIAEKNASAGSGSPVESKPKRILTPLEKLALSQIKLVAVIEMQGRTIAMVEEAGGKGYEVRVGTYIGPNGGRVTSITSEAIKIEEKVKDHNGKFRKQYEEIKFHKSEDGE